MAIKALLVKSDNGRVTKDSLLRKDGRRIGVAFDDFVGRKTSLEFSVVDGNSEQIGISAIQEQDDNQLESSMKPGILSRHEPGESLYASAGQPTCVGRFVIFLATNTEITKLGRTTATGPWP